MSRYLKTIALTALAGGLAFSIIPQAKAELPDPDGSFYSCAYDAGTQQYMTMRSGSDQPLIVWTETLASSHPLGAYTPRNRCQAVSTRLSNLAKSIGLDQLSGRSRLGYVNGSVVIFNSDYELPIPEEVVFTLKPTNNFQRDQVLNQFRFNAAPIGGEGEEISPNVLQPIFE